MIRLDTTTRTLELKLNAPVASAQLPITVSYSDKTSTTYNGATQLNNSNNTSVVTICTAPSVSVIRDIDYISVFNADTTTASVTIQINDNSTIYTEIFATLSAKDKLEYIHGSGWRTTDTQGNFKTIGATGATGPTGPQGPMGVPVFLVAENGEDGLDGAPGMTGPQGRTGSQGIQGLPGVTIFEAGIDGEDGNQGQPGVAGPQGATGATGAQGPAGPAVFLVAGDDFEEPWPQAVGSASSAVATSGKTLIKYTEITATDTSWAKQPATTAILVLCIGGGGGGGGTSTTANTVGSGGMAGTRVWGYLDTGLTSTFVATIGAGGAGNSGANGSSGGTTSFTTSTPTTIASAAGGLGGRSLGTMTAALSGLNGESNVGIGGAGSSNATGGAAAANSGAGGGGSTTTAGGAKAGGSGGSGEIYVWEYA